MSDSIVPEEILIFTGKVDLIIHYHVPKMCQDALCSSVETMVKTINFVPAFIELRVPC